MKQLVGVDCCVEAEKNGVGHGVAWDDNLQGLADDHEQGGAWNVQEDASNGGDGTLDSRRSWRRTESSPTCTQPEVGC
jgi:hypothetical protein